MKGSLGRRAIVQRHREERTIDYVFKLIDIPLWCYAVAIMVGAIIWKLWRWEGGLLVGYVFIILAVTLLIRNSFVGVHYKPDLFWSWKAWDKQKEQILANVVMFIPIGMFAGVLWKWKGLLVAFSISCTIEVLQLMSQRGLCEFDDVIHNSLGALIGISVVMLMKIRHSE